MTGPFGVRVTGPLATYTSGFYEELTARRGYTPLSATNQLRLMAHLSRWLADEGLSPKELTIDRACSFLDARRAQGYTGFLSLRGLRPLLGYLQNLGVAPMPIALVPRTAQEELIVRYRRYLLDERGLASSTVHRYVDVARSFLSEHGRRHNDELCLERLDASEVSTFIVAECAKLSVGSAKNLVCGLRSLLRFMHLEGRAPGGLAAAVPGVAGWRGSSLPRALPTAHVQRLLASCDRTTVVGQRDFAILMLLARLGLRAGEVAGLELGDINWRTSEVVVRGKGRREEVLPLPGDVGEAIVAYLRRGRASSTERALFLCVKAPGAGASDAVVKGVVRNACDRAGLPRVGAHRLRHSAATEMLRAGVALADVGQVLRHRCLSTTAIYAKVDRSALRGLALPWPGAQP